MGNLKKFCVIVGLSLLSLSACQKNEQWSMSEHQKYAALSEQDLHTQAENALLKGNDGLAIASYEALDSRFPFGPHAEQSLLNLAYAYHRSGDDASAAATATRYIHLYPGSNQIDYVYYLKAVAEFEQEHGPLMRYIPVDTALRDQSISQTAYQDLYEFIMRFPNSPYVADAKQRLLFLRNNFAQKELYAARFYLEKKAYVAAANRASYLLSHYQQAPQAKEALKILKEANQGLNLGRETSNAKALIAANTVKQST